ncbi:MAG TPA: putative sulfate/molybdate transporter [Mycobacteriales bacterium]|nr:putative sulfate/molybdate transporter [Mycobacteriales bacterium]
MRGTADAPRLRDDLAGSVADIGVLVPLVAALVLSVGFDPAVVLVGVGALYVAAGAVFRVPMPVQPIKAAAAITIARGLAPEQLAAAGVLLGVVLVGLSATGLAARLATLFATPVVRGLQLGVGLILIRTAGRLMGPSPSAVTIAVGASIAALLVVGAVRRLPMALAVVSAGVAWSLSRDPELSLQLGLWTPDLALARMDLDALASAFVLLVVPQLPLTFGNAVVGVSRLQHEFFGARASRVTEPRVALSCGVANIAVGAFGGMPLCHGSSGLTAHVRAGATTWRMNLVVGVPLLLAGLVAGPAVVSLLGLIPLAVLAGLLAFTGVMHAGLAAALRGPALATAVTMGVVGVVTANLAWSLAVGLVTHWAPRALRRRRPADTGLT